VLLFGLGVQSATLLYLSPATAESPRAMDAKRRKLIAIAAGAVAVAGAATYLAAPALFDPVGPEPPGGFEALRANADHLGSSSCETCHPGEHASWSRTFHRTMTQEASAETIRGRFDGQEVVAKDVRSRPFKEGGRHYIETTDPVTGTMRRYEVVRAVGSRRMQQYVTRIGDWHVRLPIAWSMEEDRWFHLSEAFFQTDAEPFHANTALWDINCIFCHNVGPRPGLDMTKPKDQPYGINATIASKVAELGIACEACHGPGGAHADAMTSAARRLAFGIGIAHTDPTIVNPAKLDQMRSTQVCGHCHGQRLPNSEDDIQAILRDGDPYTPGEDLARYFKPLEAHSAIGSTTFENRFWSDGSVRLTAYEYQGMTRSACFTEGAMTCLSCHTMHAGDPHGQINPDLPGNAMCTQCHGDLKEEPALTAHTRHAATSTGSSCIACHMPPVVYGVMTFHPTHQIEAPDPRHSARHNKPDACTVCHTGQSAEWAAAKVAEWWPDAARDSTPMPAGSGAPEIARALFSGDVVYRTLAAWRLGMESPDPGMREATVPLLAQLLEDPYPNVRRVAAISLRALTGSDMPHAHDPLPLREATRSALSPQGPRTPDGRVHPELVAEWISARKEVPFAFGE
jgi:predicted CXXCH cytochrome family protein